MATACTLGLMSHFSHQMRAAAEPRGATGGPHDGARLDRTAGQQSFRRKAAATTDTPPASKHLTDQPTPQIRSTTLRCRWKSTVAGWRRPEHWMRSTHLCGTSMNTLRDPRPTRVPSEEPVEPPLLPEGCQEVVELEQSEPVRSQLWKIPGGCNVLVQKFPALRPTLPKTNGGLRFDHGCPVYVDGTVPGS